MTCANIAGGGVVYESGAVLKHGAAFVRALVVGRCGVDAGRTVDFGFNVILVEDFIRSRRLDVAVGRVCRVGGHCSGFITYDSRLLQQQGLGRVQRLHLGGVNRLKDLKREYGAT